MVFIAINFIVFFQILTTFKYFDTNSIPVTEISVEHIWCKNAEITSRVRKFKIKKEQAYDLEIYALGDAYVAVSVPEKLCKRLEQQIEINEKLLISHDRGLIFELVGENQSYLAFEQLRWEIYLQYYYEATPYLLYLFFLWLFTSIWYVFEFKRNKKDAD